ncbi:MAG TPA: hypothetical protein VFM56_02545 [Solimonas sp.]|jgi:hypothetical protein|nr:hypothetical protein [Solimonas sp.]
MTPVAQRSRGQILRSRGIGTRIGTLIGVGWLAYGLSLLGGVARIPIAIAGLVIAAVLLQRARRLLAASRDLPAPDAAQRTANRRVWVRFWINFVFEIVLLNLAINLLAAPSLHVYWIPAISLVVGLHFLPMARFLDVPSYWACGGAMMLLAAATALALHRDWMAPNLLVATEAMLNAAILWATALHGLRAIAAGRPPATAD